MITYQIPPGMAPLKVTAILDEPIVYKGDGMHLDGIIARAAYERLPDRQRRRMPPMSSEWVVDLPLPLARWGVEVDPDWDPRLTLTAKWTPARSKTLRRLRARGESFTLLAWGWCASAVQGEWAQRGVAEVRKRPALDEMRQYAREKTASVSSGTMKAYDIALPTVFAREVAWYALGYPDQVRELLHEIDAIGGKVGHGWGRISAWEVAEIDEDRSVVHEGRLMRRLPVECGIDGRHTRAAIRPPYHHRSRVVEVVEPC